MMTKVSRKRGHLKDEKRELQKDWMILKATKIREPKKNKLKG